VKDVPGGVMLTSRLLGFGGGTGVGLGLGVGDGDGLGIAYTTSFEGPLSVPAALYALTTKKYVVPSFRFGTDAAILAPTSTV
jgi:hypothetical protein